MKIAKKLDCWLWFLVAMLPLILYVVVYIKSGTTVTFNDYLLDFRFDFVANILEDIAQSASISIPQTLINFLSYFVVVEISHIFLDVIVFIPRFARNLLEGIYEKIN